MTSKIHPLADVQSTSVGNNTTIWQFAIILEKAVIGNNCNINCHTFIENEVVLGDFVTIKSGVYLWDGITVEDHAFIGPNVSFTNDRFPRSKQYPTAFQQTLIKKGASIGAAAVILGGLTIGSYALIGAGAVVTKNVPDYAMVYGNPAVITGWVDKEGNKLTAVENDWQDKNGQRYKVVNNQLIRK
jgi:UDP-2-acetamido-3-amino-2,3-dideoxy-glucuronate N-acetyltransferase